MCVILGFESSITNQKQHNLTCPHCGAIGIYLDNEIVTRFRNPLKAKKEGLSEQYKVCECGHCKKSIIIEN